MLGEKGKIIPWSGKLRHWGVVAGVAGYAGRGEGEALTHSVPGDRVL